ncbi:Anthocyanidin 5,3-O-glucosyltransferase [Dichanthelium oligosanthes]|uniref:Glycosyltransferase n=1 Tax=Dichanthelium oligosanthes TaxID=888268 RepID=A0A1E5W259_9POAL|nr:Anthocyanidin 5,3-O-glucosyltransferase [Dichanthelium oligosanthes]
MVLIDQSSDIATGVIRRISGSNPSFSVHVLPPIPSPPELASFVSGKVTLRMLQLLRRYNGELERFLRSVIPRRRLRALVVDMFCVDAIDVAARLGVPAYTFFASCASTLAVLTQVPALLAGRRTGLKELGDSQLDFLGVPPVPASHLLRGLLEHPDDERCKAMADVWARCTGTRGVLVNTFEALESWAVQALADPRCVPGRALPPVYCVGPLVCGGAATGAHSAQQLKEIAVGLDRSGHRFLWVIRTPAGTGSDDQDLDAVLPERFLERTEDRGLVVASWAPQAEILRHPSTAAFVTHCGWNSALKSVGAGLPMLCWPLNAEQRMNKVFLTTARQQGMGVGSEMEGCTSTTGLVGAEEVEAKVRLVMESEYGDHLRARVAARREEARAALADGGSSPAAFARFLSDMEGLPEQQQLE